MKKIGILILVTAAFLAVSCNSGKNIKNTLNFLGTYKGELPAASGSMMTIIVLGKDDTYTKTVIYTSDPEARKHEDKGKFIWTPDSSTVLLEGNNLGPSKYKIGEKSLTQLNIDGTPVEGELAKFYILKKVAD